MQRQLGHFALSLTLGLNLCFILPKKPLAMASPLDLHGRVAIVTGGSRGLGREICLTLARHGASLVVCYHGNAQRAAEVVSLIQQSSGTAIAVQVDVSKPSEVAAAFDKAEEVFGSVHIVVNSAGAILSSYPSFENTSLDDWDYVMSVNTRGNFLVCKEAAKRIAQGGGGRIITMSTSMLHILKPGYGAYVASKAAVEATTKILAKELKGTKITANCVAPGPVATDLFFEGKDETTIEGFKSAPPLERLGEPKDVAALVLFLVSDGGEWVNGQVIRANGGLAI